MQRSDPPNSPPGLFRRLGALFYDALLLLGILFFATAVLFLFRGGQPPQSGDLGYFRFYLSIVVFVFFGWFWTRDGQTLGMRAWKIRLISETGGRVTWLQAALRFLPALLLLGLFIRAASLWPDALKEVALLSCGLFVLDFCWALLDRKKRCWHDLVAHTRMTSVSDAIPQGSQSPTLPD